MSGSRARAGVRLAIVSAVAAAALWLAFKDVDAQALGRSVAGLHAGWLVASLLGVAGALMLAVARWRLLFDSDTRLGWGHLTRAILVGQMANIVLPLRLGEIARVALLSDAERIPAARVLGTIAVERLADVVMLGVGTAVVLVTMSVPQWVERSGQAVLAIAAASLTAALVLTWQPQALLRMTERIALLAPVRLRGTLQRLAADALAGLTGLRTRQRTFTFWMLSAACFLSAATVNYLLFRAFDLPLGAAAALLLLVVLQAGNTAVSVPGNLGVFHYLTLLVLTAHGVDRTTALAFAIVLYTVALLTKVVLGIAVLAAAPSGVTFGSLFRRGETVSR